MSRTLESVGPNATLVRDGAGAFVRVLKAKLDGEIDVHYWESKMAPGSHHFILYKTDSDPAAVGTMDQTGCLTGFTSWIYSSAQPHIDLKIPEGATE